MLRPRRALGFWLSQIPQHSHIHNDGKHTRNSRFTCIIHRLWRNEWTPRHLGCDHSHHMKSGGNAPLVPQGRGTRTTALVGQSALGLNSGRQACTATAVTQWAMSLAQILAHLVFQSYTQPVPLSPHKHANTKIKIGNLYNNWYNLYNYTFRSLKKPRTNTILIYNTNPKANLNLSPLRQ